MIGQPRLEDRAEQPYVGIRTQVPIRELGRTIPSLMGALAPWLAQRGIEMTGPPFLRFHVVDMAALMDVELGAPVAAAPPGDDRIRPGLLPAGRYAVLVYTGQENGIAANQALLDWGQQQGLTWDRRQVGAGDAFGARYESYLTNPDDEPDPARRETEVAIRLADGATVT